MIWIVARDTIKHCKGNLKCFQGINNFEELKKV